MVNVKPLSPRQALFALDEAKAQAGAKVDRFHVEHSRLPSLGIDWRIAGDDGRDASAGLNLPNAGEAETRNALPRLRIGGEHVDRKDE